MSKYRPDIDGLRAIAVGIVVLFHAGLPILPGGFVGVDVFFVISGYLITAHLDTDLRRGRFSLVAFYERRARRILPALFAMLAGAAIGASLFLPDDFKMFAESAAAAVLSLSNVFFFLHTGYFDLDASVTPLLHTWSLAVEEQFYIVFPLLLWAAARLFGERRGWLFGAFAALWLASAGFSVWQVAAAPRAAFYLPFDRAWELLTGSLLALAPRPLDGRAWGEGRLRALRELAGALGLILILGPALRLASDAAFPGANALAPCLGAALTLWAGEGAARGGSPVMSARLLRAPPLVGLGLISYSLYLWHWPLLVFAHYYRLSEPGPLERAAVVVAAVGLATLSWRFVERPFREKRWLATRGALFGAVAAAGLAVGLGGGAVVLAKGAPQRLSPQTARYAAGSDDHNSYRDHCFALTPADLDAGRFCRIGVEGRRPTLAVWGDSHADAIMSAFDAQARAHGVAGIDITHASCPPLLGVEVHEREDNGCPPLNAAALALIRRQDIRTVVIAGRWGGYAEGRLIYSPSPPVRLRPAGAPLSTSGSGDALRQANHAVFAEGLERTVATLRGEGRAVWIVMPAPEAIRPVAQTLARASLLGQTIPIASTREAYERRQGFARATIERLARRYGAGEIDLAARLCPAGACLIALDGHALYYDFDHLSVHGAQFVRPLTAPVFDAPRVLDGARGAEPQIAGPQIAGPQIARPQIAAREAARPTVAR